MKVKYTQQSIADLAAIATYFETQNPSVLAKIRSDIESKIELIKDYPEASFQLKDEPVRKAITRRYR
jgi:plasmid stabilization system protein ParE